MLIQRFKTMSGKRYTNVTHDSSSDEDSRDTSFDHFGESVAHCKKQVRLYSSDEMHYTRQRSTSKRPCLNRNALLARKNRQRKKEYLQKIENKLSFYQRENKSLSNVIQRQGIDIKRLSGEVAYLRSVLNNNSSITALLRTINDGLSRRSEGKFKDPVCFKNRARFADKNRNTDVIQAWSDQSDSLEANEIFSKEKKVLKTQNSNDVNTNEKEERALMSTGYENKNQICDELSKVNIDSKEAKWKFPLARKTAHSFLDLDHTYTMTRDNLTIGEFGTWSGIESSEMVSNDREEFDNCMENEETKEFNDLLPITPTSMSNSDDKVDINLIDTEFNELTNFDIDIFNNLTKFDNASNSVDQLQDTSSIFNEENLFENLGNSGICLHVNSGKVSLEFCSICQLNSMNSEIK